MADAVNKLTKNEILSDYKLACLSREISILGRKEVLMGKAKFGIFGSGKELAQIAYAKNFQDGDFRSGYYRDQTFMLAAGLTSAEKLFGQLYGDTDAKNNPDSGGRLMNNHFSTPNIDKEGQWLELTKQKNSSADISPTAGQMPRLLGLGLASKLFRNIKEWHKYKKFSNLGNEVAFGSIGDASTSEGHFWEILNSAGVLQIPLSIAIYDDGYGISVPKNKQTIKNSISKALSGFKQDETSPGYNIYQIKGWNYPELLKKFADGISICRNKHIPVIFHVEELTQPLGHSTSGSHERYKSAERLNWEKQHDCILKFEEWIIENNFATKNELTEIKNTAIQEARKAKKNAWNNYIQPIRKERDELLAIIDKKNCICKTQKINVLQNIRDELKQIINPVRKDNFSAVKKILRHICIDCSTREELEIKLSEWMNYNYKLNNERYSSNLKCKGKYSTLNIQNKKLILAEPPQTIPGREILKENFNKLFEKYPLLVTFGEDTGKIGGVNQSLEGLQAKFGESRIFDTGIRETSIIGKAIGMALRGIRPIAEIQYFDYLLYALQTLSDDLACLHYRTKGQQIAPVIVRTRGHRLEGVWHSGSPLSMVINSIRGMHVCVPRDMTRAAGMYNTLLEAHDPALVIEPLNGYRLHEPKPSNFGEYKIPLGIPEIITKGKDITIVTYGSCVRIANEAVNQLRDFNIYCELIDVQTLLPFDVSNIISESIKKTNRVLFFDEDVPGGATSFMMQKVLEEQGAYYYLDSQPQTLTAHEHRPAYGTDGDYFSNPNAEDVFEAVYRIMNDANPQKYRKLYTGAKG